MSRGRRNPKPAPTPETPLAALLEKHLAEYAVPTAQMTISF